MPELSESDLYRLKDIFSPKVVAVPPGNPHRSLCQMPDGEIRFYGSYALRDKKVRCYMSSVNYGLDWQTVLVENPNTLGPMVKSPYSGDWLSVLKTNNFNVQTFSAIDEQPEGVYSIRSNDGPGSDNFTLHKICDLEVLFIRQPIPLRCSERWLCTGHLWHDGALCPIVLRSDDDGRSWQWSILETAPAHKISYPHKGLRWQQYSCEPTVIEKNDGTLMLISRTSQDFHYVYYSSDLGENWTSPVASDFFHATTTMPTLLRMKDGRFVFFWCNTQPLCEVDHRKQIGVDEDVCNGVWEDVFTNRDACHAAISDDNCQSWHGFREIGLNDIRDRADYRTYLSSSTNDKSVHQFEAIELPQNKILLVYGQAASSRRMVIFDPEWLYEKGNYEDFSKGFEHLSTHVYVKSISGGAKPGLVGHCAWNRTYGALLVPDPLGTYKEVLHLVNSTDHRLFNFLQGVTWNFPACRKGQASIKLYLPGAGLRVTLTDRWFNPCDEYVGELAQFSTIITNSILDGNTDWSEAVLAWNLDELTVDLIINGKEIKSYKLTNSSAAGFSYLHLQTAKNSGDNLGCYIHSFSQKCE